MSDATDLPPAPIITDVTYDGEITVTGGTTVPGTVTVYDGETAVATTTTVMETTDASPTPFTFRAVFSFPALAPGDHSISACVTTGPDNLTSQWATPHTVTVPD